MEGLAEQALDRHGGLPSWVWSTNGRAGRKVRQLPSPFHTPIPTTRLSCPCLSWQTPVPEESRVGTSLAGRGPFCSWHGRPCPQKEGPEGNPWAICITTAMRAIDISLETEVRMQPRTDGGVNAANASVANSSKAPSSERLLPRQGRPAATKAPRPSRGAPAHPCGHWAQNSPAPPSLGICAGSSGLSWAGGGVGGSAASDKQAT